MENGGLRRGLRRRLRGGGGPPPQPPRVGAARGGGRAANGGRGGGRAGNGGRGGGRAGNGGGRGQLQGERRIRAPAPPRLRDWLANARHLNLQGLSFEQPEAELDELLRGNPRINQKELDLYPVHRDHLNQGEEEVRLLLESEDKYRKMAFTRMLLLKFYLNGGYTTPAAKHWRKNLTQQVKQLDDTIYKLEKLGADHRPVPDIFLSPPNLLPKEKY